MNPISSTQNPWPQIQDPQPPAPKPKHFRVMAGPVDRRITCRSIRDFWEKVPRASEEMRSYASRFFAMTGAASSVLEVVPPASPESWSVDVAGAHASAP